MAVCVHHLTLRPEADQSAFDAFVVEELIPAARTFTERRAGLHADRHVFVRSSREERTYLWMIEWTHETGESDNSFLVAVGPQVKAKLDAFAVHECELYAVMARSSRHGIVTPTLDAPGELRDPDGWLGEDAWNVT